jgi:hypothetical protein
LIGCVEALAQTPASLVAVEVSAVNIEAVVDFVLQTRTRFPRCAIAALIATEAFSAVPVLREAGAIDAISSVLESPRLARLARRQFSLAPQADLDDRQFVAERMPWAAYATAEG